MWQRTTRSTHCRGHHPDLRTTSLGFVYFQMPAGCMSPGGVTVWLCHMPVGCRGNSKGLYWPVFFCHSHLLPLDLSSPETAFWETRFFDMSVDKLSLVSQVCLDKLSKCCQGENSRDLLCAFFHIYIAGFTLTYGREQNPSTAEKGRLWRHSVTNNTLHLIELKE